LKTDYLGQMSELKLGNGEMSRERIDARLTLNVSETDPKLQCWTELKVRDRFIHKRSYQASVIYDSRLYVYGGQDLNVGIFSDFNYIQLNKELTLSCWEPVHVNGTVSPGPLSRMSSVLDGDKWYLFGGTTKATFNNANMWCFNFTKNEWSLIKPTSTVIPAPLDSHSSTLYKDPQGKSYIVTFGGFVGSTYGEYWNQIVMFDIENKRWILPYSKEEGIQFLNPNGPAARCGHSATIHKNNLYVFGGTNGEVRFNDIWVYDLINQSWRQIQPKENPPPRNGHTSVLYKDDGLVIFGGIQDITHERDDVIFFDFASSQWVVLDAEYDHSKVSSCKNVSPEASPDRSPSSTKYGAGRGKALTDSPKKRSSQKDSSKSGTLIMDQSSPLRGYSPAVSAKGRMRHSRMPTNNSFALSNNDIRATTSPGPRAYKGLSKENEEKRKKLQLVRKTNFLKEFEVSDPEEMLTLTLKSPTTEAMKNSIVAINYKGQQELEVSSPGVGPGGSQSPFKGKKKPAPALLSEFVGIDSLKVKIPVNGKLIGHKPCARDGHAALLFDNNNKMIVFGGDRHKMSFNDIYVLNIKQIAPPSHGNANANGKDIL